LFGAPNCVAPDCTYYHDVELNDVPYILQQNYDINPDLRRELLFYFYTSLYDNLWT